MHCLKCTSIVTMMKYPVKLNAFVTLKTIFKTSYIIVRMQSCILLYFCFATLFFFSELFIQGWTFFSCLQKQHSIEKVHAWIELTQWLLPLHISNKNFVTASYMEEEGKQIHTNFSLAVHFDTIVTWWLDVYVLEYMSDHGRRRGMLWRTISALCVCNRSHAAI